MFPGYAGSVLWAPSGLVEYDESRLSEGLVSALAAWESTWETAALAGVPLAGDDEARWSAEGKRLAEVVAAELGSGFAVEVRSAASTTVALSRNPPTNPEAAEVFEAARIVFIAEHRALAPRSREQQAPLPHGPLTGHDLA